MREKLLNFNSHFDANEFDIIAVSETWLNDSVLKGEVLTNGGYDVHRRDRTKDVVPDKKDGGGVLLAVKSSLSAKRRHDLETCMEIMWVQVPLPDDCSLYIAVCYMNYPNSDIMRKFESSVEKVAACMNLDSKIVIFGDFNLSDISWCRSPTGPASIVNCADLCPHSSLFTEVLDTHALQQFNILPSQPQVTTNVLDLVMSNGASTTVTYTEKATSTTHSALHVVVDILAEHHTAQINREVYNFKRADWREINTLLNYVDWSCLHDFTTVDEAVTYFYDIVFAIMKDCIPVQRISYKRYPYWFDPQLISLIKSKAKFHREYIRTNRDKTSTAYLKFCHLRKEVKALQKSKRQK